MKKSVVMGCKPYEKSHVTLEKVLSSICFLAGTAFFVAAIMGLWRHFFTMGLCIAVGIMMTDDGTSKPKCRHHEDRQPS